MRPALTGYCLRHVTIPITKWFPKYGTSSFCPFGNILGVLLAQVVLGSDCSGSMKELRGLLQPVLRKAGLKKSLKKRKEKKTTLEPFSGSKSRDAF